MKILIIAKSVSNHSVMSTDSEKPVLNALSIQFGISYISAVLKDGGNDVELLVLSDIPDMGVVARVVEKSQPLLICFTASFREYDTIANVAGHIKLKFPSIYLLVGGPHISMNPEKATDGSFDALCIGEGEYPVLDLVGQLEKGEIPSGIRNLWIKRSDGSFEKNRTRDFVQELDKLPFPDREMWRGWIQDPGIMQTVLAGRGCPYKCSYCINHRFRKLARGKYVRFRRPEKIIAEIKTIVTAFPGTKKIFLEMESIGVNKSFYTELCSSLERYNETHSGRLTFGANMRVSNGIDYDDLFGRMASAGINFVQIGVESGSKRIREKILKRRYSNKHIVRVVDTAKNTGSISVFM